METLSFEIDAGVGWVRLNRPDKRNPFDAALRTDLLAVLDEVRENPDVRVLVLAGSPGAFCAGGNLHLLKEHAGAGPAYWQQRIRGGLRAIADLLALTRPLIAVIDGPAYGAGFALALTADMVLATPRARFAMSYLRLGLVPDLAPMYLLPRMVGLQRAKELMFSTREIDAAEAKTMGLVMEVHDSEAVEARAREIALAMTRAAPALNASMDSDQNTMFTMEAGFQAAAFGSPEPAQAIDRMLARQPAVYQWPAAPTRGSDFEFDPKAK
jgi:2-(1,2-epoxy-1,2-dihydrophenyl)acetyl-CoA isomerase